MDQKLPKKDPDEIVRETHVYSGPLGDGYIEYEYRMVGDAIERKANHVGPENRVFPSGWNEVGDLDTTEVQQTGTVEEDIDEVIETIEPGGEIKKKVKRVRVEVPVYGEVLVTRKHPYKNKFYGVK